MKRIQAMYKSILLPLDGSAMAEQVLPYAAAQAEHFQAELILMKILEPVERSISLPPGETSRAEKVTSKLASEY
jgi:nucleotide-binding universal stress UspA family protein